MVLLLHICFIQKKVFKNYFYDLSERIFNKNCIKLKYAVIQLRVLE